MLRFTFNVYLCTKINKQYYIIVTFKVIKWYMYQEEERMAHRQDLSQVDGELTVPTTAGILI